ncbi:hypothetical protein C8R43DRAFT_1141892 [Mycena crocata]|nr:hypothetical protein C8R43DRAFT_1141892 [Mycena crocata]
MPRPPTPPSPVLRLGRPSPCLCRLPASARSHTTPAAPLPYPPPQYLCPAPALQSLLRPLACSPPTANSDPALLPSQPHSSRRRDSASRMPCAAVCLLRLRSQSGSTSYTRLRHSATSQICSARTKHRATRTRGISRALQLAFPAPQRQQKRTPTSPQNGTYPALDCIRRHRALRRNVEGSSESVPSPDSRASGSHAPDPSSEWSSKPTQYTTPERFAASTYLTPDSFAVAPFPSTRPNSAKRISATSESHAQKLTSETPNRRVASVRPHQARNRGNAPGFRGVLIVYTRSGRIEPTNTFLGLRNGVPTSPRPTVASFASRSEKRSKRDLEFTNTPLTSDTPNRRAYSGEFLRLYAAWNRENPAEIAGVSDSLGAERTRRTYGCVFVRISAKRSKRSVEIPKTILTLEPPNRRADDAGTSDDVTQRGIERMRWVLRELCTKLL